MIELSDFGSQVSVNLPVNLQWFFSPNSCKSIIQVLGASPPSWASVVFDVPLSAHVLVLDGHAGNLPQPDALLDVSELQTQVFSQDGHPGPPLPRPGLRE